MQRGDGAAAAPRGAFGPTESFAIDLSWDRVWSWFLSGEKSCPDLPPLAQVLAPV